MINNNKILTVSYGTFSCTLEGFDDSFGTMKAIAEYFRGLASDDRYFGAEPPQPDAEMLARIAQKEISRRVEAREHEGKIVLSALGEDARNAPRSDAPVADKDAVVETASIETAEESPAEDSIEAVDVAPTKVALKEVAVEETIPEAPAADVIEDAAQEIEAAADDAADEIKAVADDAADEIETAVEDAVDEIEEAAAPQYIEDEDENDIVPGQPDAEVEAFFDSAPSVDLEVEEAAEAKTAEPASDPNSIAAKLQRIRAVVAQQDDNPEEADYSEDQHAEHDAQPLAAVPAEAAETVEEVQEDAEETLETARREIEDALNADEELDAAEEVSDAEVDDIAAMLARMEIDLDTPATEQDAAPAPKTQAPVDAAEDVDHGIDTLMAELSAQEAAEDAPESLFTPEDDAAEIAQPPAKEAAPIAERAAEVSAPKLTASKELELEPQPAAATEAAAPARPRARVIKVKRADLDAAIERGDLEEYDDEDEDQNAPLSLDDLAPAKTKTSSLSAEEEDELARELAALEADIEREQAPAKVEDQAEIKADAAPVEVQVQDVPERVAEVEEIEDIVEAAKAEEPAQPEIADAEEKPSARAKLPAMDDGRNADMDRLMAETDHQMGQPESATRRDAFAHLRAAVAAKKADEALGSQDTDGNGDDAYRNDLADVVRPRRPASSGSNQRDARPARPNTGRTAPLKLVAEQRVDVDRPAPSGPVRPRRVAGLADAAPIQAEESFGEFAAEMGATKLPELLEAAAAYMAFVEGREQFSRPQLMTKVRQASTDGFSREDTLRSFGQLLRDGKIEKIKGGRFVASDDIGFRPDERAAG